MLTYRLDINLALTHGIDGFALNIGSDDWQEARVADAYAAARGSRFKLFISFDMAYLFSFSLPTYPIAHDILDRVIPCGSRADAERVRKYITGYWSHPNQMKFNDRMVVSTFAGESCRFGTNDLNQGWLETLKSQDMPPVHPLILLDLLYTSESRVLGLVYPLFLCRPVRIPSSFRYGWIL